MQKAEVAAYVHYVAPLEAFQLPYEGAKTIQVPQGEWTADLFQCSFSCVDRQEIRDAYEVEKKGSSQMFFYGAAPKDIVATTTPIRELMAPITEACGIYFDDGSSGTRGGCEHATLGHGEWKATIERDAHCSHILLTISFFGLNNDPFFEQVERSYLKGGIE
ncbi:MAG TPA: hypothetical protein VLF94_07405 [Chlamydiales bacterium]|nr:hypothetical protein [Chlamydiales bacterium]